MLQSDPSINLLVAYGAVVGTAGLLVSIYVALRDRPRLSVYAGPDDPARDDVRLATDRDPRFLVHVMNRGRRPVAIERIWYTSRKSGKVRHLLTDRFDQGTQTVSEGNSLTYELHFRDVTPTDLRAVFVEAQDGRRWRGKYDRRAKQLRWNGQ